MNITWPRRALIGLSDSNTAFLVRFATWTSKPGPGAACANDKGWSSTIEFAATEAILRTSFCAVPADVPTTTIVSPARQPAGQDLSLNACIPGATGPAIAA